MSTLLRFLMIFFSISVLVSMGVFLFAGGQVFQLIFLGEREDESFWVLDFRSQVQVSKDGEKIYSIAQAIESMQSEGGKLKADLDLDFALNKDTRDYSKRLMLYEFSDHHGYLYAITNPDFEIGFSGASESSKTDMIFAGYGDLQNTSGSYLLACLINKKSEEPETIIALDNLKKTMSDLGVSVSLEMEEPILWGRSDWQHVWLLDIEDRESAVRLLNSAVFQSQLLITASFLEDLSLGVYH